MDLALGWLVETVDRVLQLKRVCLAHLLLSGFKGGGPHGLDNRIGSLDIPVVASTSDSSSVDVGDACLGAFVDRLCGDRSLLWIACNTRMMIETTSGMMLCLNHIYIWSSIA